MKTTTIIIILLLLINGLYLKADSVDSLRQIIDTSTNIEKKVDLYLELSEYFLLGDKNNDIAIDSAYYYALISKNKEKIALTSFYLGSTYNFHSDYDTAISLLNIAIEIFTELNDTLYLAASWGEKGNAFCYRAIYDKCLDCFLKSLEYTEDLDNNKYLGTVLNNIGNVYYYMENDLEALKYYEKAYKIFKKNDFYYGIALASNNIGSTYLDNKDNNDSALYYFKISEKYAKKIDYFEQLAETSANMAKLFHNANNYTKAKEYSLKSISLFKKIGSEFGLAKGYSAYSKLLFEENNFNLSKIYIDSCFITAQNVGATEYIKQSYFLKYQLDSVAGNDKSALSNYLKYTELKDSLKSQEVEKQIANLQSVYELDKKQKENLLLKIQKSEQEMIIQRQRLISIFTFVALFLFLGLLIVLYFFFRTQKKNNEELKLKNEEISQQKEEIISQNEVLTDKNEEILRQQAILQKQRKNTTESINYAKRIQHSSMPDLNFLKTLFSDSMLIYLPKSIISGDFYFYKEINAQRHIIAIADCTGHGVPGALISILNISILKEILRETPKASAAQILERARELLKLALKQDSEKQLINDGMDIALIVFNPEEKTINYSGANRDLIYFNNSEMKIIKANKQPIAAYIKEIKFDDNIIQTTQGDTFYLFSDGFPDQMSEHNYSKYLLKKFKTLLVENQNLTMNEQKELLLQELKKHKGNAQQTDDITILGFKI